MKYQLFSKATSHVNDLEGKARKDSWLRPASKSKQVANLENKTMSIDDINQHKDLGTGSLRKLVFIE